MNWRFVIFGVVASRLILHLVAALMLQDIRTVDAGIEKEGLPERAAGRRAGDKKDEKGIRGDARKSQAEENGVGCREGAAC